MSSDPYGTQDPGRSGSYEDYSQGYSATPQQPQPTYGQPPYTQPTYGQPAQDPYGQPTYAPDPTYGQPPYAQQGYGQGYQAGYQATPSYGLAPYGAAVDSNPRPSVTLPQAVKLWLKNWKNFTGRASRSEYWWLVLAWAIAAIAFYVVFFVVFAIVATTMGDSNVAPILLGLLYMVLGLVGLAAFVPTLSLSVRRLHDANLSGWMYLLAFVPFGSIIILILMAQDSNPVGARFDDRAQPLFGPEHL